MSARRKLLGTLLVLHGLAHTLPGMRAAAHFSWVPTMTWAITVVGLVAAGTGLLGAAAFRPHWRTLAAIGVVGSMSLLVLGWPTLLALPGLLIDLGLITLVICVPPVVADGAPGIPHRSWSARIGNAVVVAAVVMLGALVLARPRHMRWGTTDAELQARLPGDELVARPTYLVQHTVTIPAPPDAVWPWLAQLGQDRGGFYSYAWLENLLGLRIRNADRVHPEWQHIAASDSIYATPAGWLGFDHRFGWRVAAVEPDHVLVLEQWGAFVLRPVDNGGTRFIVRTRGGGETDRFADLLLAPLGLVLGEPAHFIMERKMLLEVKRLATSHSTAVGHTE